MRVALVNVGGQTSESVCCVVKRLLDNRIPVVSEHLNRALGSPLQTGAPLSPRSTNSKLLFLYVVYRVVAAECTLILVEPGTIHLL